MYGTHMLKSTAVKNWAAHFWSGRESVGDDAQAGWPATTWKKCNEKLRRTAENWSEMSLTVPIFHIRASIKFYSRIWRWRRCVRTGFESFDARTEEIMSLHCRNIFERLWGGSAVSWTDHHGWWVVDFRIWSVHKASVNAEQKRRTAAQKSWHSSFQQKLMSIWPTLI